MSASSLPRLPRCAETSVTRPPRSSVATPPANCAKLDMPAERVVRRGPGGGGAVLRFLALTPFCFAGFAFATVWSRDSVSPGKSSAFMRSSFLRTCSCIKHGKRHEGCGQLSPSVYTYSTRLVCMALEHKANTADEHGKPSGHKHIRAVRWHDASTLPRFAAFSKVQPCQTCISCCRMRTTRSQVPRTCLCISYALSPPVEGPAEAACSVGCGTSAAGVAAPRFRLGAMMRSVRAQPKRLLVVIMIGI